MHVHDSHTPSSATYTRPARTSHLCRPSFTRKQPGLGGKGGIGGIEHITQCDFSEHALLRGIRSANDAREAQAAAELGNGEEGNEHEAGVDVGTSHVLVDEEFLPFAPQSFDLVMRYVSGCLGTGGLESGGLGDNGEGRGGGRAPIAYPADIRCYRVVQLHFLLNL